MQTKKIWANLAVTDLARTTQFYTQLGFKQNGTSKDLTSFMVGEDDFVIHFFLQEVLQPNIGGALADLKKGNEIIFTLSADSIAEVNEWALAVRNAGGQMVTEPVAFGEGYYGFVFADPDGHKFNIFHM